MLAAAGSRRTCPFKSVIVDDLSRLSRDLGNTWRIVFGDLAASNIAVIDVMTGLASDREDARITFAALAMVNDYTLQVVRKQTHRGLEGRALNGFWTGGKVYGFTTITEPGPANPEPPRKLVVINEAQADVVKRIFQMAAEGHGLKSITSQLNQEGIAAPYDGKKAHKSNGRGWAHTTIRAMLLNERYVGTFIWNKRKYVRAPERRTAGPSSDPSLSGRSGRAPSWRSSTRPPGTRSSGVSVPEARRLGGADRPSLASTSTSSRACSAAAPAVVAWAWWAPGPRMAIGGRCSAARQTARGVTPSAPTP